MRDPLPTSSTSAAPLWLWGVLICVFATGLTSLGLVLQKFSHTLNERRVKELNEKSVVYYRQPWWLVGFSIFAVAQVINLISMSMAPQVMLSCLGATALIFNAIFACILLEEELRLLEGLIMFGMLLAVMMVIATTPIIATGAGADLVLHDILHPLFAFRFLSLTLFLLVVLVALRFTVVNEAVVRRVPDLDPVAWTICAAVSSGFTVNLFKAVSELLTVWDKTRPYAHWQCYLILLAACVFGVSQVHCLNKALNLGRAMMVVPTYFSLGLLAQLGISEAIIVDVPQTTLPIAIWICGIVLILVLIVLLVRAKIAVEILPPDASNEEVFEKALGSPKALRTHWPSTPQNKEATDTTALLSGVLPVPQMPSRLSTSLPPPELEGSLVPPRQRFNSWSAWDPERFQDSFEGRERIYSVSVIGFGIA